MGQDPRADGTALAEPHERLREQIELTRRDLGETVAALAEKADIKSQARHKVEETKSSLIGKRERALDRAKHASPDEAVTLGSRFMQSVRSKPAPAAVLAALLVGLALGRLSGQRG